MQVLVVQRDQHIAACVRAALVSHDIVPHEEESSTGCVALAQTRVYDVIVLGLEFPDLEGFEVLDRLRHLKIGTPVMIVSGISEVSYKVRGLDLGADDYVTVPFHHEELLARLIALQRRAVRQLVVVVTVGDLTIDVGNRVVMVGGNRLRLTRTLQMILELLALRKGSVVSSQIISRHIYGYMREAESNIIPVFLNKLRAEIGAATGGKNYIRTIRGLGYVLDAN